MDENLHNSIRNKKVGYQIVNNFLTSPKMRFMNWLYFNDSQESFFISSHHSKRFLTTSSVNTFNSSNAHPVYDISSKPERYLEKMFEVTKKSNHNMSTPYYCKSDHRKIYRQTRSGVLSINPCSKATPRSI